MDNHYLPDKSIVARVGIVEPNEINILDLPSPFTVVNDRTSYAVSPPPPPYNGEHEDQPTDQCPHCKYIIPIDEDDITYCTHCYRILFVQEQRILYHAENTHEISDEMMLDGFQLHSFGEVHDNK